MSGAARWRDGYVVDVPYIEPLNSDLCPAHLSMVAVLNGQPPLDTSRTLTWAELGSGSGLSACMVAAANANVEVWGCDYNPAHVERSRSVAARAGLANCRFDEASFAEVADDPTIGPAEVDVVVVHGVYSWISGGNQRHIAEFVRRRLRPGGLVYVSYETPAGWASMVPLAELMRLHAEHSGRRSDLVFPDAAAAVQRLVEAGPAILPLGPFEASLVTGLHDADPRYGAHEYLGGHFHPVMFDEVASVMAGARCTFLGGVEATDHLYRYWAPEALTPLLTGTDDLVERELLRDLIVQRPLRRDVYRRGFASPSAVEQERWLEELTIVGLGSTLADDAKVSVPVGHATLDPAFHRPLVDALAEGPLDVAAIRAIHPEVSLADATAAMALLVNGGYAAAQARGWEGSAAVDGARRLNEVLIAENLAGGDHRSLVAPATGSAVGAEYVEMVTLAAVWDGLPADVSTLAEHALAGLDRQHRRISLDGAALDDRTAEVELARSLVETALARMAGRNHRLGIC